MWVRGRIDVHCAEYRTVILDRLEVSNLTHYHIWCLSGHQLLFLSRAEEPVKTGTCARDRRALQQLALNVHIKHSDPT